MIMVQGSHHRNSVREMWDRPMDDGAGPRGKGDNYINWKEWLGPTKKMDWSRDRGRDRFFRFRKYWEYSSGGVAGDLLYHNIAPVTIALGGPPPVPARRCCGKSCGLAWKTVLSTWWRSVTCTGSG